MSSYNFENGSFIRLTVDIALSGGDPVVRPLLHVVKPLVDFGALESRAHDRHLKHLPLDRERLTLEDLPQFSPLPRQHKLAARALADRLRAGACLRCSSFDLRRPSSII